MHVILIIQLQFEDSLLTGEWSLDHLVIVCDVFFEQTAPSEGGLWGGVLEDVSLQGEGAGDAAVFVRERGAWLMEWGGGSCQDHQGQDFWGAEEDSLGGAGPAVTWSRKQVSVLQNSVCFAHVHAAQACEQEVTLSKATAWWGVFLSAVKKKRKRTVEEWLHVLHLRLT